MALCPGCTKDEPPSVSVWNYLRCAVSASPRSVHIAIYLVYVFKLSYLNFLKLTNFENRGSPGSSSLPALPLVAAAAAALCRRAQASHRGGLLTVQRRRWAQSFHSCRTQAVLPWHGRSPWARDRTRVPGVGRRVLELTTRPPGKYLVFFVWANIEDRCE